MGEENKNQPALLLDDVDKENIFQLHNTEIEIHNLYELADALEIMSDESYGHHVNANKNDFAEWVRHIIKDEGLSLALEHARDRLAALSIVRKKIKGAVRSRGSVRPWLDAKDYRFTIGLATGLVLGIGITYILLRFLL